MAVITIRHGYPENFGEAWDAIERAYPKSEWDQWRVKDYTGCTAPHCDQLVLHAPGECSVCDLYPDRQKSRVENHIAFTGHRPHEWETPCPADTQRPPDTGSWHGHWHGNIVQ